MNIAPSAFFDGLHPENTAFAACSKWEEVRLVHAQRWQTEALSGSMIVCLGAMPAICHHGAATDAAFDFFRLSGIEPPSRLETYRSDDEASRLAGRLVASGKKLATVLPQAPQIRALDAALVAPSLHDYLNDKQNLNDLCHGRFVPARRVYRREAIRDLCAETITYPVYVKGAVEGASGGGLDVHLCGDCADFRDALAWFEAEPAFTALIVEVAIPFTATWCLNFAILDRAVRYIGAAEQLFSSPGRQNGSLIDPACQPPPLATEIGADICRVAQERGYRGLAGLDMCVGADGRIYFFDLNFRMAGSTCFILLEAGMDRPRQVSVMLACNLAGRLSERLSSLTNLAGKRRFVPLQLYEGIGGDGLPACRIAGFVGGETRSAATALSSEVRARLST